jgi:hypothetical protein
MYRGLVIHSLRATKKLEKYEFVSLGVGVRCSSLKQVHNACISLVTFCSDWLTLGITFVNDLSF